ncbi:GNAT family N-acetyltransferase [Bacillus sp. Marseille-Q3570]|uniref:GNAT family N-acetyltransferase n=1 Tax=Bacillus sp. Marseille-Q3570 TaxID=2963522 RepID=UPI0021B7FC46|nr:GNAT family N-acetyltransferase [Bacillus sp. Marseille-Q3570]
MNTHNVELVELNEENWYECCKLEVSSDQEEFIESNAISIAQSKYEPTLKPYAIYFEEKVVGFLMYNSVQEELDGYWVYRIMVDKEFQGKGIGKLATKLMISEIAELPNAKKVVVGYHPENSGALRLYST